ncbi:MAG: HlyC/CorC family transporter [Eggerthellaceae bacterium]|nr:HlyC/CorC family transporter [Eggerthellaceae bacterium]
MPVWLSFVLVAFFLAMNAFFVIAEFAMVRVRPSQIEIAMQEGKKGAKNAKKVTDNVNAYLAACQLGITLASLALGWLGEPAFSALIRPLLEPLGIPSTVITTVSVAIGYILMTTLHVVAGEQIPKSLAIFSTEQWCLRTAGVLVVFYRVTYPIMWLFNVLTRGAVRLAGHDPDQEHEAYTDEEIKLLIDESTESGLIDPEQNEFVDNIFDIGDKDAVSIMTPRTDIVCLDMEDSLEENLQIVRNYKYTRYPVCEGSKDRIVGFVHVKDLYMDGVDGSSGTMSEVRVRPIEAVPEGVPVGKLLQALQDAHTKMAVVVDEHGGTSGIVTMSDVMEQIVGHTQDEYSHGDDGRIVQLEDGSYLIDGSLSIDDTVELLGFEPDEADECETAGGLLLTLFDRIPSEGDAVTADSPDGTHARFLVVDMDNLRIDKISVAITRPVA